MSSMRDWERKRIIDTGTIAVELVKLPERQSKKSYKPSRLTLHVKKSDSFRGILIDDIDELNDLIKVLTSEKIKAIAIALAKINGESEAIEIEL